jgi:hypothetical protein
MNGIADGLEGAPEIKKGYAAAEPGLSQFLADDQEAEGERVLILWPEGLDVGWFWATSS